MTQHELQQLLDSLSPAEKAGQLAQIPLSACAGGISDPTGPMIRYNLTPEQVVLCGSLICDQESDAQTYARIVRELREAHPHKIPPILMRDIIHGFTTVFPIPLALGCTFDEALAEEWAASAPGRVPQPVSMPPLPPWWMWCGIPAGAAAWSLPVNPVLCAVPWVLPWSGVSGAMT